MKVTFDPETNTLTVPKVAGVIYSIDGTPVTGQIVIEEDTEVFAEPVKGMFFKDGTKISEIFRVKSYDDEADDTI